MSRPTASTGGRRVSRIPRCRISRRSECAWCDTKSADHSAYTIVESTTHSIAVDILTSPNANIGTLFVSSGEGTWFVQALSDTNRNDYGIVDFEQLVGLEGVGIANVVANREEVVGWNEAKKLKSVITYDDGEYPAAWRT
jgi:hypothetical protein